MRSRTKEGVGAMSDERICIFRKPTATCRQDEDCLFEKCMLFEAGIGCLLVAALHKIVWERRG
jgi:hypothetical protein